MNFINYLINNSDQIISLLIDHIQLTFIAVGIAILIGVPLGILICYMSRLKKPVMGLANLIQAIPSMALLGFAIPFLGIGNLPAVIVVTLYSLLPIIKNTVTGISNINKQTLEAAKGIGLTKLQILYKIEIPLSLPVIMAGVRISAVTAVGLMTMAAFIGGDGLGFLVFSGIRTVNNYQILAGAIPACILALLIDYLSGIIENLLTPRALLPKGNTRDQNRKRTIQKIILGITSILLFATFIFGQKPPVTSEKVLIIGSKDYTEQLLLSEMASQIIEENTDIEVIRKLNLGGTQVAFGALKNGNIDMYIEYSGTAFGDTLKHTPNSDMEFVYNTVVEEFKEKFDIKVLQQMNFNNTYTLAVKEALAEQYNLTTFSDLESISNQLTLGATLEFLNREDGLLGLQKNYALNFASSKGIDGSSRYVAINNDEVQVIDAFATDGLLKKFNLRILEDDQSFFPPYYAMPIMKQSTYDRYPEIEPLLNDLGSRLDNETMMELNYQIDELGRTPEEVAREFLKNQGLVK